MSAGCLRSDTPRSRRRVSTARCPSRSRARSSAHRARKTPTASGARESVSRHRGRAPPAQPRTPARAAVLPGRSRRQGRVRGTTHLERRQRRMPLSCPLDGPLRRTGTTRAPTPAGPGWGPAYSGARPRRRTSPRRRPGDSRQAARVGCRPLVTQKRADPLDGIEILVVPESKDAPAVRERLVDREVETVVTLLHLRSVERARSSLGADPAAARALPGRALGSFLEEQQLDSPVGGRLEGVGPACGRSGAAARFLAPALGSLSLLLRVPLLEDRPGRAQQVGGNRVRLGVRPTDDRVLDLVREHLLELGAGLLRRYDHDPRAL